MLSLRFVSTLAVVCVSTAAQPVHAEVFTTLRFFEDFTLNQNFLNDDIRVVSDSETRDDAVGKLSADASADLGTGELKARATGQKLIVMQITSRATAIGRAIDTLTVEGPGTAAIPVTFQMLVDGDLFVPDSAAGAGSAFATAEAQFEIGGIQETSTLQWRRTFDASGSMLTDMLTGQGDWQGSLPSAGTTNHFDLVLQFDAQIVPGTPFAFESELRAHAGGTAPMGSIVFADFGNTGRITVILPSEEYSLASESTFFLAGPIPEPGTWALLAGGLCILTLAVRRWRL